ncbi:MAG: ABC transporter ATP-binding protein [Clostridia bacterium]|nr:ABC transporter ATP-binding protein [Clostridia bacterium]
MIEFQGATKIYGKSDKAALDHLSLKIGDGCVYGFLGPNGAGKTTAIRLLTGALRATEGKILVNGIDVALEPVAAKRLIGFVPDSQEMYDKLTGWEYLNFMADIFGVSSEDRKRRGEKYLEVFEMTSAAGDRIASYSRGMKQKIASIGALIHNPPVWVLDEPMVGLDPRASFLLKEEMKRRAQEGATVFFSTHVLEVAEKLCDQVGIINHGRLVMEGRPEELTHRQGEESLEELFLELTETGAGKKAEDQ